MGRSAARPRKAETVPCYFTMPFDDVLNVLRRGKLYSLMAYDRDAAHFNVPRLEVADDGAINVNYEKGQTLYSNAAPTGPLVVKPRL